MVDDKHTALPMTRERFEALYAAKSGVTVEWLHVHGRFAEPCDCGEGICYGWAMGHQWEDALFEDRMRDVVAQNEKRRHVMDETAHQQEASEG